MNSNRENVKKSRKLVSAGVFIALYFVVFVVAGTICMPIPPLYLCMLPIIALLSAAVYQMLLTKAPMHGPIFIASMLPCLFLLMMGNIWIVAVTGVIAGLAAEIIAGMGNFRNRTLNMVSYFAFSLNLLGGFLPIWVMREEYFKSTLDRGMSQDFVDKLRAITPGWVLVAIIVATIACGFIGTKIGDRMFAKHFTKAGIA
uniref:MptD family putative ECF transporter S component n=1 Tax=Eubacterium cellulosolvens TaxID=29322 RepID=UPI000485D121|nr:MptD family putative ECF transporter S component [[Eubacterium] cellulosolvens]